MHHAVAERRGLDDALFGVNNDKLAVIAMPIRFIRQFPPQNKQIFFQAISEFQNGTAITFALSGAR